MVFIQHFMSSSLSLNYCCFRCKSFWLLEVANLIFLMDLFGYAWVNIHTYHSGKVESSFSPKRVMPALNKYTHKPKIQSPRGENIIWKVTVKVSMKVVCDWSRQELAP